MENKDKSKIHEQHLFKEQHLDGTERESKVDYADPLEFEDIENIQDPLQATQELANTETLDLEHKQKKRFGKFAKGVKKGKKVLNEVDESEMAFEEVEVEEFYEELTIEELEQKERQRQRAELARAEIQKKKADRRAYLESFKTPTTLIAFALYTAVCASYVWWLSDVIIPSILVSMIASYSLTYWFSYKKRQLDIEEREFRELANIATQISFNMQNGKNVADTLYIVSQKYSGRVGADLNYTYSKLMVEGELVTDNFEKYNFRAFDIFMRNLQIAYHDGVEAKKLFIFPLDIIGYEKKARTALIDMNKASIKQEMLTLFISIGIPASIRMAANEVFMAYLGYPIPAFIMASIALFAFAKIATYLKKTALDVAVSI